MKKLLLLALPLMMVGCNGSNSPIVLPSSDTYKYKSVTIDSCEYIMNFGTSRMAHKGNCKFCKERRQKELKELVSKLKEK